MREISGFVWLEGRSPGDGIEGPKGSRVIGLEMGKLHAWEVGRRIEALGVVRAKDEQSFREEGNGFRRGLG
jgi:hypothetical protein